MSTTMLEIRRSDERGRADHGWLLSRHTFSFADYYAPKWMGFRTLRVINEDIVKPGMGFGTHGHRDMEIVSYVLGGALEHKDSMGTGSVIRPGDVQRMSAGTGVTHSEYNASKSDPVHFLQIWIVPERAGIKPSYEQKHFAASERQGQLRLIASPNGEAGSVTIHQDAKLYATLLAAGERVAHTLGKGRKAWVHVARGSIELNGQKLAAGDAGYTSDEPSLTLVGVDAAEVLVFDLA